MRRSRIFSDGGPRQRRLAHGRRGEAHQRRLGRCRLRPYSMLRLNGEGGGAMGALILRSAGGAMSAMPGGAEGVGSGLR